MNTKPYTNFELTTDDRGVLTVTLDVPGRPMNVLDHSVMTELEQIVHELEESDQIKLVVFRSGKESGFLAGADVRAISTIQSGREAGQLIEAGQLLLQRIEWLPIPTLVVIHGPCLGGGLELSLACDYRVARDNSSTKIGLPEIKLGLIPGWGGTQRLPKLVGLSAALPMILTGKHLDASEAVKVGLIDRAIDPDRWDEGLQRMIDDVLGGKHAAAKPKRPLWRRRMDGTRLGRWIVFRMAGRSIRSKVRHYPALDSALKAIRMGYDPGPAGYSCERSEFVKLLATPTCRNLLGLFFARERARNLKTWSPGVGRAAHDEPARRIGVVGAGAMGAGIGQLSAYRGFDVVMKEVNAEAAEAGRERIEKLFDSLARRKGWSPQKRSTLVNKVSVTCDDDALADCDLVVEAVVERDDVKADVFSTLDRVVKPSAILASNTSSLSVTRMAEATKRPSHVAGLHFFNPVHRMELVEVVRAKETDDETIARLVGFVRALGKTPIVTTDSPGFLVNRVLFPYLGEAVLMVAEAYDVSMIDKQVRRFGMPMGPLELLDQVGLDVALHVATSLDDVLPGVTPVIDQLDVMVSHGHLGRKSGLGFYHYNKGKRGEAADLPNVTPGFVPPDDGDDYADDSLTTIQRRLVYPMLAEAIRCHEEKVVREPWAIDLGMVLGTGFAPHHGGPLHLVDSIGLRRVLDNLDRLRTNLGQRFAPPAALVQMADRGESFFLETEPVQPSHTAAS